MTFFPQFVHVSLLFRDHFHFSLSMKTCHKGDVIEAKSTIDNVFYNVLVFTCDPTQGTQH